MNKNNCSKLKELVLREIEYCYIQDYAGDRPHCRYCGVLQDKEHKEWCFVTKVKQIISKD